MKNWIRKSHDMTQEQWDALQELAEATHSLAPSGPTAGQANWRSLLTRIAKGEVLVIEASVAAIRPSKKVAQP